jgi:predicted transcriptional regulator
MATRFELLSRRPRRVTITVPDQTHRRLLALSDEEGRSLSNLASYLLEQALHERIKAQQSEALR